MEDSFHVTQRWPKAASGKNGSTLALRSCSALRRVQKNRNICQGTENRRPPSKLPTAARLPAARPKARPRRRRLLGWTVRRSRNKMEQGCCYGLLCCGCLAASLPSYWHPISLSAFINLISVRFCHWQQTMLQSIRIARLTPRRSCILQ